MKAILINDRIYLDIPYELKDMVKTQGAKFDGSKRQWWLENTLEVREFLKVNFFGMLTVGFAFEADEQDEQIVEERSPLPPLAESVELYPHQKRGFHFTMNEFNSGGTGVAMIMDCGVGKTITALAVAAQLYKKGKIKRLLVTCPLSVIGAWQKDIKMLGIEYTISDIVGYSKAKTAKNIAELLTAPGLQVAVINYESAWRMEPELLAMKFDMAICDESQRIKSPVAKQSRFFHKLGKCTRYKLILTGTPVANSPLDYFSQYKFLNNKILGDSYYALRARYAIIGGFNGKEIIGYRPEIRQFLRKVHSIAYRVKIDDCTNLPPFVDTYRTVQLEPEAKKLYNQIAKDCYAELSGGTVTTAMAIVKCLRLSQITGGFVGMDTDENTTAETRLSQAVSTAKLNELVDICEDIFASGHKVVIFARFRAEIAAISKRLQNIKHVVITGDTPSDERTKLINEYQTDPECKAFISNAQCAGLGVTLTAGNYTVYYSYSYSYLDYEQSRARTRRIGQTLTTNFIHIEVEKSIDQAVLAALKQKRSISDYSVDEVSQLFNKIT